MFIGFYRRDNEEHYDIYYKNRYGYEEWHRDTFSPLTEDIVILDFKISGKSYQDRKNSLEDLAKDWQLYFSGLDWSYGELATIYEYFTKNGRRYGLLREFKENCIC